MREKFFNILFIIILGITSCSNSEKTFLAEKGLLDLSNHDFTKTELVVLKGEWEFFWKVLIPPDFQKSSSNYVFLPKLWTSQTLQNQKLPSFGFASYRLKVLLPQNTKEVWLRSYEQATAYELFANGRKVLHSGKVGTSPSKTHSHTTSTFGHTELDSNELELVLHVSNFKHRNGGIWHPIKLGTKEGVISDINYRKLLDIFQIGALFTLALYYFGIYLFWKLEKLALLFSLLSFTILIRVSVVQEKVLLSILDLPYEVYVRMDYISIFLVSGIGLNFIIEFLKVEASKLKFTIQLISLSFAIFCAIAPIHIMTYSLNVATSLIVFCFLISFIYIYKSSINQLNKKIILIGLSFFFLCALNDILVTHQILSSHYISGFGLVILVLSLALSFSFNLYQNFAEKEKLFTELVKTNESITRFVPNEFLNLLGINNISSAQTGTYKERELCIMFSDIRGFTSIAEKLTPKESFEFLNVYYAEITPLIQIHEGFIDKFIGDGIMAIFPNGIDSAIQAGIDMQKKVVQLNKEKISKKEPLIQIGIGIHSGPMILGIIGNSTRNEGTVIADAVNLASRVEELTKTFNTKILITSESFLAIEDPFLYNFRFLDVIKVKGKEKEIGVVEILDGFEERIIELYNKSKIFFEEGLSYFKQKQYTKALNSFDKVIQMNPFDKAASYYHEKCRENLDLVKTKYY